MSHLRATFAVVLGFTSLLTYAAAADATVPVTLSRGTLPNGLAYAVLPHPSPKGDVSLRLIVRAGSLDERDDERGFAHFVEHMAFNGTRRFPAGTVRLFFEKVGLRFGGDVNASTTYTHTNYLLDLPAGHTDRLDEALILLRDYADGQLFLPEEVKREAPVVISEVRARDSAGQRTALDLLKVIYAGTRVPEREVLGVPDQIEHATADQLRAFYRRTYSPARMTVVVVGPIESAAMVEKISTVFGSMTASADSEAPAAAVELPHSDGVKTDVIVVPTSKAAVAEFNFVTPRPPDTAEGRRQEQVQRIATAVIARRLEAQREHDLSHYSQPKVGFNPSSVAPSLVHHSIEIGTASDSWADGVQLVETELRRARSGCTQAEVDEAVAVELTALFNRVSTAVGQPAATIAGELAAAIMAGREWQTPTTRHAEAKTALQGLTSAEVTTAFAQIFPPGSFQLILLVQPDNPVKPDRVLAAYNKSAGRTLRKSSTADEELKFRYEDFGPAGQIVKRDRVDDLDLSLVSFENGVRLNVRPSAFEPERFRLRVVFPLNLSHVPDERGGIAELAGQLLLNSNLKQHKQTEIIRLLRLHGISPAFGVSNGTPAFTVSGPATELPFALQFLTALLSDLDFDLEYYKVALSRYGGLFQSTMTSASGLGMREALRAFAGNDPRTLLLNPRSFANDDSFGETESWLRDHILNGPLEIGLVGDFTAEDAISAAAGTVGTLKRRKAPPKPGAPLALPKKASRQEATADIPASASFSVVLWPVTFPDDPKHNAALELASDLLRDRLLLVVREAVGATYSPTTQIHRDVVQRDFAFVSMINTFEPAIARRYTEASVTLATRVAERGIGAAEFERIQEPARSRHAEEMRNNAWWLNAVVARAQSRPDVLEEARRHEKILDEVTVEDVNQAAQVFKSDKATVLILRPKSVGSAGGDAAPAKK